MGAIDRLFSDLAERERIALAEFDRMTRPMREMDEAFKARLAQLVPVRETMPDFNIVERLAAKLARDSEEIVRSFNTAVEQMQHGFATLVPPRATALRERWVLPQRFIDPAPPRKLWYGRLPGAPKRRIGFV